jgi:ABC-2 type transport system permease protein
MVAMVAFWWLEIWGILFLKRMIISFLAGTFLPLTLLPAQIAHIFTALPFQYMVFFPIQVAQGKIAPADIRNGIILQLLWIVVFTVIGGIIWRRGMKQYSAAGI